MIQLTNKVQSKKKHFNRRNSYKANRSNSYFKHACFYYNDILVHQIKLSREYLSWYGAKYNYCNATTDGKTLFVDRVLTIYSNKTKTVRIKRPLSKAIKDKLKELLEL